MIAGRHHRRVDHFAATGQGDDLPGQEIQHRLVQVLLGQFPQPGLVRVAALFLGV